MIRIKSFVIDAEIQVPSAEDLELTNILPLKPGVYNYIVRIQPRPLSGISSRPFTFIYFPPPKSSPYFFNCVSKFWLMQFIVWTRGTRQVKHMFNTELSLRREVVVGTRKIPGGGGRERLCLTLHCQHQNDSCIKMGVNESHFNGCFIN